VACATCHDLARGGVDHLPRSRGVGAAVGTRNAPTVYNSGQNLAQFWDGRAASLEAQVDGPLTGLAEMSSSFPLAIKALAADPGYARAFADAYPDGLDESALRDALATFERSLSTPGSRFDRYLAGDAQALTEDELAGYRLFKSYGCASCHQGANVGGNLFERLGVLRNYFAERGGGSSADLGRYLVTGLEDDRHRFRVPSLRLAVLTAPYLHDGSVATLEEAIHVMAEYQLGRDIKPPDVALIIRFLGTLPGEGVQGDAR